MMRLNVLVLHCFLTSEKGLCCNNWMAEKEYEYTVLVLHFVHRLRNSTSQHLSLTDAGLVKGAIVAALSLPSVFTRLDCVKQIDVAHLNISLLIIRCF